MSARSSVGNVSPKGSSSTSSILNLNSHAPRTSHYPPPYWQVKMAKNYEIIKLLEDNMDLRYALHKSPTLAEEFMRHPDVSREVARDKKLATEIIRRPHLLEELANFHHYAHQRLRKKKVKEFVKLLERGYIKEHYNDAHDPIQGLVIPLRNRHVKKDSETSMAIARATLPNIAIADDEPSSIKYIMKSSRLFLRHDISVEHGCGCLSKRTHYYNILNAHGRLLYRVFRRHKQVQSLSRPYELVVKDPDGLTVFVFAQVRDKRYRHKLAVYYPKNKVIGYVEQTWGCPFTIGPMFLKNKDNERMIRVTCIKRPLLSKCRYHSQFRFELRAIGVHNVIGQISSEWMDTPPGAFESERIYGVSFPQELGTEVKIILLAAWMLVFVKYYKGKLEPCVHHTLNEHELALMHLVEDSVDELHNASHEPSSNSESDRDEAVLHHFRKTFEVAAISANKRVEIDNIAEDMNNQNNK